MERRISGPRPRPLDHGDPRTPMAWQHRNINYQQQHNAYTEQIGLMPDHNSYRGVDIGTNSVPAASNSDPYIEEIVMQGVARNRLYRPRPRSQTRPTSPSTETSATNSSTAEPDTEYAGPVPFEADGIPTSQPALGTLRSVQSTLSTWDGEPCPVHHVPVLPPSSPPQYSLLALPPPMLLPPMLRPRPLVMPADNPAPPEPLPVRDPKSSVSPLPPKETKQASVACCKGHIIVLWIILSIIFVGVLLGVILRFVVV